MIESSITKKGQTTLPKPVRETLGVQAGDRVRYVISDGEVRILPVRPIGRLFGALRHDGPAVTVEEMEEAVADGAGGVRLRRGNRGVVINSSFRSAGIGRRSLMRTSSLAAVVLLSLLSLAPMAEAQVAAPDYVFLDTERTSTLQRELQEAADNEYRLVPIQGSWGQPTVILEKALDPEPIEYLLLATSKAGTLQGEIAEATAQGYRLASVFENGWEALVVMQRAPGQAEPTHEYVVLGTKRVDTMEKEFLAAAANGFKLVGRSHYTTPSITALRIVASAFPFGAAGGAVAQEILAVLERPIPDQPSQVAALDQ